MKFRDEPGIFNKDESHLTRGAWIEMLVCLLYLALHNLSHLTRGAWIEMHFVIAFFQARSSRTSHEVRGLKSHRGNQDLFWDEVAPHTRCVD